MRAWPKIAFALLLALPMTALVAPSAEARGKSTIVGVTRNTFITGNTVTRSTVITGTNGMRSFVRIINVPTNSSSSSFFPLTNGVLFPTNIAFGNQFNRFGSATGFAQSGFGWWDSSLFGWSGPYVDQSQPPRIIVIAAGPRQPPAPPPEAAKITVETTPSGVQVVRGPGSRHLYRYSG